MTPQELLVATEKAAGNEHLLEWHTQLIENGKTFKKLSSVCRLLYFCRLKGRNLLHNRTSLRSKESLTILYDEMRISSAR